MSDFFFWVVCFISQFAEVHKLFSINKEALHYELIRALLDTGAQQTALAHYEYVVDLFYSEFGINLSENLTTLYQEIIRTSNGVEVDLSIIRDKLQEEDDSSGAFYCEYALFKEIYHLECRSASRNGQSIYLCLISATDGNNHVLENLKQHNVAIDQLINLLHIHNALTLPVGPQYLTERGLIHNAGIPHKDQ